jgi:hypothetical protein
MHKPEEIINRVANSTLVLFNLEDYYQPGERVLLDLKHRLHEGLILREKDFREYIRTENWAAYAGKHVAVTCSADAIIPVWAYMLVSIALRPHAKTIVVGSLADLETQLYNKTFDALDWTPFKGARVVIKGCARYQLPPSVYAEAASRLRPLAKSIMYGEPCSNVPLFKSTAAD